MTEDIFDGFDIDDIDSVDNLSYELWVTGYDLKGEPVNDGIKVATYKDLIEAVDNAKQFVKDFNSDKIDFKANLKENKAILAVIEVETIISEKSSKNDTESVETIFREIADIL